MLHIVNVYIYEFVSMNVGIYINVCLSVCLNTYECKYVMYL